MENAIMVAAALSVQALQWVWPQLAPVSAMVS